jgi:hypothetical protein
MSVQGTHAGGQVRGVEAIRGFSRMLTEPYVPAAKGNRIAELEAEVAQLRERCAKLEQQLGSKP